MVTLSEQAGGIASAAARLLLERKNGTDWSNRQLADSLGWSRNTVDRYLHGERAMPLDAFYRLSRLLDLDPVRVLREAEQRTSDASTLSAPSY
jgi:transcriptional regulator with XRE-family HTH domain